MKGLSKLLAILGALLVVLAVVGRFVGVPTISFLGLLPAVSAKTVLLVANTILLLALVAAIENKE